ncbi:MAG TPA: preprotein translocase subunit YajC [Planctomycetota bacterium]|nr:preprotein translocase subunit YajC [Planctomycetota bacterium]
MIPLLQSPDTRPASPPPTGAFTTFLPIVLIFLIFYMLVMRPERKRQRKRQELLKGIKKNDRVVTSGGLHGVVAALTDHTVVLKVDENVRLRFNRDAIAAIVDKEEGEEAARGGAG